MASPAASPHYTPRVTKALGLYERMLEATGGKKDVLARWITELLYVMDDGEREAYYRHVQILRHSRELRVKDDARAHRG